ncbi:MAG: SRPBCC family protein [Bacteroidota bacterium]
MKNVILIALALFTFTNALTAQSMSKKYRTFTVSRELPFSAEKVWAAVAEDYGNIANNHPKIISSNYAKGSLKGEKGAQRHCYFNEKGSQALHEEITDWRPEEGVFVNRILTANKFPVDPDNTRGTYMIKSTGPNSSTISMKMDFRTRPAFMGFMAQNKFKKLLQDYFIAVEHNIATGESVTAANFKDVKKMYN